VDVAGIVGGVGRRVFDEQLLKQLEPRGIDFRHGRGRGGKGAWVFDNGWELRWLRSKDVMEVMRAGGAIFGTVEIPKPRP